MKSGKKDKKAGLLLVMGVLALIGGLGLGQLASRAEEGAGGAAQHGPMPVDVEIVKPESVRIWSEFSGRLSPVEYAVIQPQVGGKIMEIRFGDGQSVEKGDVLFVIDPRPYKAAQDQAQAALNAAQNQYELARKDMERAQGLIGMDAISGRVFDERQNTVRTALAAVEGAKAELQNAKINLEYAYIKAPISGRVGRAELTVGNVVQAGPSAPVLTSVVSSAGIYADFDVDEQTYLNHIFQNARGLAEEVKIPVQIALRSADGAEHVIEGRMHNFDNRINPDSGTIRARAIFENADGALLPGMFVKVRMGNPDEGAHILLSEKAIGTDQDRKFVYTVDETDTVKYRQVTLGDSAGDRRVILSGLNAGDRVIVEGVIRIRPDMPVQPVVKTAAGKDGVESAPPANPQALLPAEPKEQSMQPVETEE